MHRVVRAVLVWLVVVAMPVQGLAASTLLFCGPGHARMMQGLSSTARAHAGHDDGAAHRHAGAAQAPHEHPVAQPPAGDAAASPSADGSCSVCAACCSVLALPAVFGVPAPDGLAHAMHGTLSAPLRSHPPDGLDRPPRTDRA